MELRQIAKILLRWWWLVAIPVLVVGAAIGTTYRAPTISYQVVMQFAAGTEPANLSEDYDRYYPWLASEYIANGLADIAKTGVFADAVATRLGEKGIAVPAQAIQGALASDNTQSVFVIYITWPDASQIIEIAEAVTEELVENGAFYFPQLKSSSVAARRLDTPTATPLPPSLRAQLTGPALKLLLAAGVGLGLAFLAHYLDPTIHSGSELEAKGIQVLSNIPPK